MIIYLNDKSLSLEVPCSLQKFLEQNKHIDAHIAVSINNKFIPRPMFSSTVVQANDRINLVVPMQGG